VEVTVVVVVVVVAVVGGGITDAAGTGGRVESPADVIVVGIDAAP
jgi:hypothetical protein